MKVSGVCPNCGRATASKGRSECLYCGASLDPVATGVITAPGSGEPVVPLLPLPGSSSNDDPTLRLTPGVGETAPPPRRATAVRPAVPNLYRERAEKMQAEGINPVAEFFRTGAGKFVIWLGSIGLVTASLFYFISSHTPTIDHGVAHPPGWMNQAEKPAVDSAAAQGELQARSAVSRADAASALRAIATSIEKSGARDGQYPDFVSGALIGLETGRNFDNELSLFAGGRISDYRVSHSSDGTTETFVVEAISRETGEKLQMSGTLKIENEDSSGFQEGSPREKRRTRRSR